ncbi:inositol monophosphatase family protein [Ferruginibacter paludis]|uniref:inositol monophosphatase family protein n=1 Tax=Ferruginibacter paludis TaxID=1310417 RepID=UPI0025B466D2|nr:inositol monophosphatase family protein [Ferruginibacter paludis]MDN3654210.1 inositol monophosphatase family protein [Ferruginibacter paludis]
MKQAINVPIILNIVKTIGDEFAMDFKKERIPAGSSQFLLLFNTIEQKCLSYMKDTIYKYYPGIPWVEDELNFEKQKKANDLPDYWICDTMDGAVQYMQHLPGWTINLVLIRNGQPNLAIIYDPIHKEMFWAEKDQGAFLNNVKLKIAQKTESKYMLTSFNHPPLQNSVDGLNEKTGALIVRLLNEYGAVRNYGPCGLQIANVGAGRIDLFCQEGLDTYNWIAGILIAKEAGAAVLNINGDAWQWGDNSLLVGYSPVLLKLVNTLREQD